MPARRQVRREVAVAAPPEEVWRALVERDLLARWLGTRVEPHRQPGGEAAPGQGEGGDRLRESDGTAWARRVVSAERARRLVYWWWRETGTAPSAGDVSVVEIDLDPAAGGTRVTVTETALADHDGIVAGGPDAEAVPVILGTGGQA